MKKIIIRTTVVFLFIVLISSCKVLKEYERMYINDIEMSLSDKKINRFETNFQTYREGASGANGGKSGGGCGCN